MKKELRGGYTTGACMAAGVMACLLFRQGRPYERLTLIALDGTPLDIPVKDVHEVEGGLCAEIVKDAGDDPDITNGVSVFTTIRFLPPGSGVIFKAGQGIGTVTKPGLSVPVGEPSINPGPRKLVQTVLDSLLPGKGDVEVTVSIPAGTELAKRTLNPILGVEGGISVIGTTGVLRPMSEEGFKNSLVPQIDVAKAAGYETQIFVPGKIGENMQVGQLTYMTVSGTGIIGSYVHSNKKLGVLVELTGDASPELAKDIAMQIAATNPICVSPDQVPAETLAQEREIYLSQAKEEGKPAQIAEKIVEGRIRKFYQEVCLVEQAFIKDDKKTIKALLGKNAAVARFCRFAVGA